MKLSLWRPKLITWLQAQVNISSWYLNNPEQTGTNSGFIPPLRDVSYRMVDTTTIKAEATQDIYIVQRHSRRLLYSELPLAQLEGMHSTLSIRLVHDYRNIADIDTLEYIQVDTPIKVSEIGEDKGDWLIESAWSIRISWNAEPEVGQVQPPFNLSKLNVHLWRDNLSDDTSLGTSDPTKRVIDYRGLFEYDL